MQLENCQTRGSSSPKQSAADEMEELNVSSFCSEDVQTGLIQVGSPESRSIGVEKLKLSNQNSDCGCLSPNNGKLESDRVVALPLELKEVMEAENSEEILLAARENTNVRIEERGATPREVNESFDSGQIVPLLEDVKMKCSIENLEMAPDNVAKDLAVDDFVTPQGDASDNLGLGQSELVEKDGINDATHSGVGDKGTPMQLRKRNSSSKTPVIGTWFLRSRVQEKASARDPNDTIVENISKVEKKRRGRKKEQMKKIPVNEFSRTRSHLRYLLHRIKYEQNLIDAYSTEGWKGQSLEKLKPDKELQHAKSHILRYKLKVKELFQRLDHSLAAGRIPESLFDSKGEIDSEDIFCAKCGSMDLPADNDIILCDGACLRGFHQFCLEPPLLKEDIPPGDEGWLCPGCNCKVYCIDLLNNFQGTKLSILDNWEKIFPEAASAASRERLDHGSRSSSDDDYNPHKPDTDEKVSRGESFASDNLVASHINEQHLGFPSDNSEDDDYDPAGLDRDEKLMHDISSSDFTSDSEDLGAVLDYNTSPCEDPGHIPRLSDHITSGASSIEEKSKASRTKRQSLRNELLYLLETNDMPVSGKRHAEMLDYRKLYDETYGSASSDSSDEDFEATAARKRRKINAEKAALVSPTSIRKIDTDNKDENRKDSEDAPGRRTSEKLVDGSTNNSSAEAGSSGAKRPTYKRLGEAVTQRLLESFKGNQYPEPALKENLSKELGLTIQQVSKWFENARFSFHHRSQMESIITDSRKDNSLPKDKEKPPEL